jgi:Mor family transcriptional regulator
MAKQDLIDKVGKKLALQLIRNHMDVCGSYGNYFCHWVKCPEIGLNEDLYNEHQAQYIAEARSLTINDLLEFLDKKHTEAMQSHEDD